MAIQLSGLSPKKGSQTGKKRLGRGLASRGTTSGRGQKGQKSRAGSSGMQRLGMRKLMFATPKLRGFKSNRPVAEIVNLETLEKRFEAGDVITPKTLKKLGVISTKRHGAKILGEGEVTKAFTVKGCAVSKSAAEKILAAGGEVIA
jgi:large subunit ribosomal protein L15